MDVLFAVMPFAHIRAPSIGVSLLKAEIALRGFSSRIEYFNIELAELIGVDLYGTLASSFPPESLVGEWFFADVLFDALPEENDYLTKVLRFSSSDSKQVDQLLTARKHRRRFIDQCVLTISQYRPRLVAFTTTFHQTCASLAVARRLKELPCAPITVFGGANCEGEMGLQLVHSFPWVDYACTGEGDLAFPQFLDNLFRDHRPPGVPGIVTREDDRQTSPQVVEDLDSLPLPDYSDYFERLCASSLASELKVDLLMESSRGCWWGAKQHCIFCGLNGDTMKFRSKSPSRVFSELATLSQIYGVKSIECVDNILSMKYIPVLFDQLRDSGLDLELFYEVKANLRYDQVEALRAGGVLAIQPGIESFSNEVLRLMRKGCTGLQNIQLLRWCEELDIKVGWNLLAGFPGESPSEYNRMEALLPLITHLQPPASCFPVRLDRFSPFFTNPDEFGFARMRPTPAYYYVFPLGRRELARLAYFFDFDYVDGRRPTEYLAGVGREVKRWISSKIAGEHGPRLDAFCGEDEVIVTDTRSVANSSNHRLRGLEAEVYVKCDSAQSCTGLWRYFASRGDELGEVLRRLTDSKLMIADDDHYLSLAVIRNRLDLKRMKYQNAYSPVQEAAPSQPLLRLV